MKYYLSITQKCPVELYITRTQMYQFIQIDLTRDEILDKYKTLDQLILYSDASTAVKHARYEYYQKSFNDRDDTLTASKDQLLISRFGRDSVYVRKTPVDFIMEVEVSDESILDKISNGIFDVELANKSKLKLNCVTAGAIRIENTEAFAKESGSPLTRMLIKPAHYERCVIL